MVRTCKTSHREQPSKHRSYVKCCKQPFNALQTTINNPQSTHFSTINGSPGNIWQKKKLYGGGIHFSWWRWSSWRRFTYSTHLKLPFTRSRLFSESPNAIGERGARFVKVWLVSCACYPKMSNNPFLEAILCPAWKLHVFHCWLQVIWISNQFYYYYNY